MCRGWRLSRLMSFKIDCKRILPACWLLRSTRLSESLVTSCSESSAKITFILTPATSSSLRSSTNKSCRLPLSLTTGARAGSSGGGSAIHDEHRAAALRARWHFGKIRGRAALNFGDCIAYATAQLADEPLLPSCRCRTRNSYEPKLSAHAVCTNRPAPHIEDTRPGGKQCAPAAC